MPTILAIETSSELASCALLRGDAVLSRDSAGVRTHSQAILPMVQSLLADAGLTLADCDAIAYGAGPGSFTGVRTACGIAQGLAFGAGLPVVPVMTLEAMALACRQHTGADDILAVLDARMGEVYWSQYRFDGAHGGAGADIAPRCVLAPALSAPAAVQVSGHVGAACGNGLSAYAADLAAFAAIGHPALMPHALQIGQLARVAFAAGRVVAAADAQPLYLRNKIAFTSAERVLIQQAKAAAAEEAGS
jgi:tRNA threonylcarbamoyladenosine biosynthesis protein TsaB